ncbi:MAG: hypothetical protein C4527_23015 [Candidatus Omnitrophota bacterium]|jgi:alpha-L-rhamnosidase|nr:MAG: hypothetical protein C4527_23015 [Candidatus Omnitrophota bacterium]
MNTLGCIVFSTFFLLSMYETALSVDTDSSLPHHLLCEYLHNPIGIDETAPRLSWQLPAEAEKQTVYRVLVASNPDWLDEGKADVWDSGKVESDQSIHVVFAGKPLQTGLRYYWKVRIWDARQNPTGYSQPAFWQMGMLKPSDWKALWIGYPRTLPENHAPHVGYHSQIEKTADNTKWVQIDLGNRKAFDEIILYPVQPFDYSKNPGFLFPLRFRIDVADDPAFDICETVLDLTGEDVPHPGAELQRCRFPAREARFVRLTVVKLTHRDADNYGFALAEMAVVSNNEILSTNCQTSALDAVESDVWSLKHLTDGVLETREAVYTPPSPSPMLRKTFHLDEHPARAAIHVSALGLYELRLNGQKVGDHILAPEWTDYHQRIQYQAYDVTDMVRQGENAVGAILAEGWYAGLVGLVGTRQYGSRLGLLLQLEIHCADGSVKTIVSDESWKGTIAGPIRGADIIRGETYDARMELNGWDTTQYDDQKWTDAIILPAIGAKLVAQPNEPIRITQELKPISVMEPNPGVYVFDLGQNMVGWCRLKVHAGAGQEIQLRHAEVLNPDGTIYTDNLRGNNRKDPIKEYQKNTYICSGNEGESFEPHFTYHGFRYVEVRGLPYKPTLDDLSGCVFHSAAPISGNFECSDPMLNRLTENIVWTLRGNLHSTPTDCPQRDERLGWMGDAQLFSQAACFTMNMAAFFTKWCQDIRDAQAEDGRFSDFSPNPVKLKGTFLAAPAWADAGIIVPWRMYENYGDTRILERHFEAAKRWVDYVRSQSPERIWEKGRGNDYGDWLNGDWLILDDWPKKGADTPREIFATAFFAHSTELLSRMAAVIGREEDARKYANLTGEIKEAFNYHFVRPDGRIESDTQTIYAFALHFDLLPEGLHDAAVRHLLRKIKEYNMHVSTGIQGTNRMMLELALSGNTDVAYQLLKNTTVPSWGYMLECDATTVWERWDGWVKGRGFHTPGMNSFNHYAMGAVGEWMVKNIVGINPDPQIPAFKHFILRPRPGGDLTYAKGELDTLYGKITNSWQLRDGKFHLECAIPPNTTAKVYLPTSNPESLIVAEGKIVQSRKAEAGAILLDLNPGRYHLISDYSF